MESCTDLRVLFLSPDWLFEVKWDGFRCLAYIEHSFPAMARNPGEMKGAKLLVA
jgi:ATP-dependent DNA ligase